MCGCGGDEAALREVAAARVVFPGNDGVGGLDRFRLLVEPGCKDVGYSQMLRWWDARIYRPVKNMPRAATGSEQPKAAVLRRMRSRHDTDNQKATISLSGENMVVVTGSESEIFGSAVRTKKQVKRLGQRGRHWSIGHAKQASKPASKAPD